MLTASRMPLLAFPDGYAPLATFLTGQLDQVEEIFRRQLESDLPAVNRLCACIERYRGKMLRPTLTLLAGLAADPGALPDEPDRPYSFDALTHAHRVIAAVCEMVHMATLVHDDVLDDAEMRRQGPTLNHLEGNEAAVMLGDYLISNAFHLCSTLGRPAVNRRIGETTNTLCEGELLQIDNRDNFSIDEPTYFEIIRRKTASLIGLCCELGAAESGARPSVVAALADYGRNLGVAFQIQDDLLDLMGDPTIVGKSLGKDLEKGKLTLPFILFLAHADAAGRETMLAGLSRHGSNGHAATVRNLLRTSGALERAHASARRLVDDAKAALEAVPPSPIRDLLEHLADAVITRRF